MPIACRLLNESCVFGFHVEFLLSIFIGFILIGFFTRLKQDHDLRYGFLAFKISTEVSEILCLFLLFALGFKVLYSPSCRNLVQFLFNLSRNSGNFEKEFCPEKIIDGNCVRLVEESTEKSSNCPDSETKISRDLDKEYMDESDSGDEDESRREEDDECDVSGLRKLVKNERGRADAALAELVKERAASASAAEEAMAMILRLQNEKSSIEMEANQYRRLAEEKQNHDHRVIQSLQWLVWKKETKIELLQQELNRQLKMSDEDSAFRLEEDRSGNAVENIVLCSSLELSS